MELRTPSPTLLPLLAMGAGPSWLGFPRRLSSSWEGLGTWWSMASWNTLSGGQGDRQAQLSWEESHICPHPTATRSLGLSEMGLQRIREPFISHFPERALRGVGVCVCEGAGTHLFLPVNVMLCVHPPRQASRPGTLGVRPLTGSVAAADGRRRQGAETSVAHAAACPPRKGLHTSQRQQQRPCLEPIRMQAAGRQRG